MFRGAEQSRGRSGLAIRGWRKLLAGVLAVAVLATTAACSGSAAPVAAPSKSGEAPKAAPAAAPGSAKELTGAGATFPYPLYSKWFDVYNQKTGIKVNYQSVGSGAGIKQLTERTVDFGASDAPMSEQQIQQAGGGDVFHIPTVTGAVVVIYNLQGVEKGLKLTPETLSGIYLGQIKKWSDPRIVADNAGIKLPDTDIALVHRSDGSGTTSIFTDYLSAVSADWKGKVGKGTSVNWPAGLGAKGNEGVAGQVKQTPGAVGYVELAYAVQNKLTYAALKNQAGQFVDATIESTTAAAAGAAATMPDHLRVSLVNAPGANSYPIAGFTWLLVRKEQGDAAKSKALVDLLWWGIHDGQQYASELLYAPLPPEVVKKAEAMVRAISSN
ncbi:MAG: phosphate ABC transporter substrate-binding protein PstS [Chloroflexota bacterium]